MEGIGTINDALLQRILQNVRDYGSVSNEGLLEQVILSEDDMETKLESLCFLSRKAVFLKLGSERSSGTST
jgi:hypothetical protein